MIQKVTEAKDTKAHYYDDYHMPKKFFSGDKVWLRFRNIKTPRSNKKLNYKRLGSFTIFEAIENLKYCLGFLLYKVIQIHSVFHIFFYEIFQPNALLNQI